MRGKGEITAAPVVAIVLHCAMGGNVLVWRRYGRAAENGGGGGRVGDGGWSGSGNAVCPA